MKTIPEITLPSNPSVTIRLRETTVADAIDFAGVQEGMEEAVTSLFLERLQDKATFTDPKKWTGEDRRLALFWYWMHTTDEFDPALSFECSVCGENHTVAVDLRQIANNYKVIQGKAERDVEFEDGTVIVRPLSGESLEKIEMVRLELMDAIKSDGTGSGKAKTLKARISLLKFMHSLEFSEEKGEDDPIAFREKKILAMGQGAFIELADKVESAISEMEHGLPSLYEKGRIYLLTPSIPCTKTKHEKEVGTQLRLPFRNSDYIPRI